MSSFNAALALPTLRAFGALLIGAGLAGCATPIKPQDLATPSHPTCINLSQRLESVGEYGLFKVDWEMYLERGPYLSEKEDTEGTYYRAPPGGIYVGQPDLRDRPASVATHMNYDGGFFIPRDPSKPPRLYNYYSPLSAPVVIPPEGANCSNAGYIPDPSGEKVSVMGFMFGGALGGAAGRAAVGSSGVSYGQAAAGGAIAGAITAALINMDVGKIVPGIEIKDQSFLAKLRELHSQAVPLERLPSTTAVTTAERAAQVLTETNSEK